MQGKIIQFRRGAKRIHEKHFIVDVGVSSREEAFKFLGKEIEWKSSGGKIIKGKIASPHGNKGLVRVIFERGLPGQARNDSVEVK